jgi:hypothetical protein
MSNRISQMYGGKAVEKTSIPAQVEPISEDSYIEQRRNVANIKVGDTTVAVPTVAHAQEMTKKIQVLDRHVKQLTAENRRMRSFINKMVAQISKIDNTLDNKMDKL